jgi:hypothetical protein
MPTNVQSLIVRAHETGKIQWRLLGRAEVPEGSGDYFLYETFNPRLGSFMKRIVAKKQMWPNEK